MSTRILLGITGSSAAYKGVALASGLTREGLEVDCVITGNGLRFISATQLMSVTGRPVHTEMFAGQPTSTIPHIALTESARLMVVAPATADFLARAAAGLAPDLLSAAWLAHSGPRLVAPAMNSRMWESEATSNNVEILGSRGVVFAGPVVGRLACGSVGSGRMMEPEEILKMCLELLDPGRTES